MKAYNVSEKSNKTIEEKIELIKTYNIEDLLYVLREAEKNRKDYNPIIISGVVGRLYDMGIKCM